MTIKKRYRFTQAFSLFLCTIFITSNLYTPAFSINTDTTPTYQATSAPHENTISEDRIIVKYKDEKKSSIVKDTVKKKLKNFNIDVEKKLQNIDVISVSNKVESEFLLEELKNSPYVEYAQPDYKLEKFEVPQDDSFYKQWGLYNRGQAINGQSGTTGVDINACSAWNLSKGNENVIVGILDTGIDINHPDLKNSIYINAEEIPGNNLDDDNNGYVDDINGWDFINSDNTVFDNINEDFHATHIAGIIAAKHNGQGVCGISPNIKILPLKFFNDYAGYTSDAIEAIQYAEKMGVKAINCSFGDTNYNYALEQEMRNSNILFVCASSNKEANLDYEPYYPACYNIPNKITVAAVDNKGKLSDFSNYGSIVDIAAPGSDIFSTVPDGKYDYASGTSMAAPFVAAEAALIWSLNSDYSVSMVKGTILGNVKNIPALQGKVRTSGIVDADKSLKAVEPYIAPSPTYTPTNTATLPATPTPSPTSTFTPAATPTATFTATIPPYPGGPVIPSDTNIITSTPSPTNGLEATDTPTSTIAGTLLPISTPIPTSTPTNTIAVTNTVTPTNTHTPTSTYTPMPTPTPYGYSIKGKVYIPGNVVAQDDIKMEVYLEDEKGKIYSTDIDFKKGTSSHDFTLYTLGGSSKNTYQIAYYIYEGDTEYGKNGYYTSYGTTFDDEYAEYISISKDTTGINIDLLTKRKIRGSVSLPNGKTAPAGGLDVKVVAGTKDYYQYVEYIKIPEGNVSANYELNVFENNSKYKYYISYEIDNMPLYLSNGFYNSQDTKIYFKDAEPVDISSSDISNINMTLLPCKRLSGTVRLPYNKTAPSGGISVIVKAQSKDRDTYYTDRVNIAEGKSSADYFISLPYDYTSYYVSYYTIDQNYVEQGYYSGQYTTTAVIDNAVQVTSYNDNITNINLTLISGVILKGTVMISDLAVNDSGIKALVFVESEGISLYKLVKIEEHTRYAEYTITVPESSNPGYLIRCFTTQKGFVKDVYYKEDFISTPYFEDATIIPVYSGFQSRINMRLVDGSEISGVVSLPAAAPVGGLDLSVLTFTDDYIGVFEDITIPQGST
ncbi:MAG TPA: S8 family serine peptidase [Pseudobacteroides sp.]|uniref:S8 family peptidase n=1 Tax=Pseudobacteroides sp. TaxID=1968840 RepID=UPI002F95731E